MTNKMMGDTSSAIVPVRIGGTRVRNGRRTGSVTSWIRSVICRSGPPIGGGNHDIRMRASSTNQYTVMAKQMTRMKGLPAAING